MHAGFDQLQAVGYSMRKHARHQQAFKIVSMAPVCALYEVYCVWSVSHAANAWSCHQHARCNTVEAGRVVMYVLRCMSTQQLICCILLPCRAWTGCLPTLPRPPPKHS